MNLSYKGRVDYNLKYLSGKSNKETTQLQDMLNYAGLPNIELTSSLKAHQESDMVVIIPPYAPMNGVDTSLPMKPYINQFDLLVTNNCDDSDRFVINKHYNFFELVDIFNSTRLVISQVGWAIPLAEMLDVPAIAILTERALNSSNTFINTITAEKICRKKNIQFTILS